MQLLVITYGAVGVYNPQVVVLHGACDDHQTSLFPPQCLSFLELVVDVPQQCCEKLFI